MVDEPIQPNVCYVVAAKTGLTADNTPIYTPEREVQTDFFEAVQQALVLLEEDPACDPRVVQVILDPNHPSLKLQRLADTLEDEIIAELAEDDSSEVADGLQQALDHVKDAALIVSTDDIEDIES